MAMHSGSKTAAQIKPPSEMAHQLGMPSLELDLATPEILQ